MFGELYHVITATPDSNECTKVYIYHLVLPITMRHINIFHGNMRLDQSHRLFNQLVFHHLRITVVSPLILQDRSLHLTIDNVIYALTPPCADIMATPHRLHFFLNPHNRMPYLQHTNDVDAQSTYHLVITTSLPSTCSKSKRP